MSFAVAPLLMFLGLLGPERVVSPPVTGPNPGSTGVVQVLARPGGFYAIYSDDRSVDSGARLGLRGARLSPTLDLLDPTGFPLPVPVGAYRFRALHDGSAVVLAWTENPSRDEWRLAVSRVSESGEVVTTARTLAASSAEIAGLAAAHDGSRTVVAWIEEGSAESTLSVAALDAAGNVTGPWTIARASVQSVAVASSGGTTLIAWSVYRPAGSTIEAIRIAPGAERPTTPTVLATRPAVLYVDAVGTSGGAWFLAWSESPTTETKAVVGAALPASGGLGTPQTIDSVTSRYAIAPRLAFAGTDVRVLWTVYLDVRARTVPLTGAPTSNVQVLRDRLGYEPGAGLACSASACVAKWTEPAPGTSLTAAGVVTRLTPASAAVDVPAREISFPADANTPPSIVPLGEAWGAVFERRIGRAPPELVLRRFDADGAWVDGGPAVLGANRELAAVAPTPAGGALLAVREPFLSDDHRISGYLVAADGSVSTTAPWVTPHNRPWDVHVACGTARCGLLYEQSQSYLSAVLDTSGALVAASNVYVSSLGNTDSLHFRAVGSALVAVSSRYLFPVRAAIVEDTAFPAFGAPVALGTSTESVNGDFRSAVQGGRLATIWSERNGCRVLGRVLDVASATPIGPDAVLLHECENHYGRALSIAPRAGGYSVLFSESGARGNVPFVEYWQRDTDADLVPVEPARLVESVPAELAGVSLTRVGGRDVYSYSRFDNSPGVSARRGFLAGFATDGAPDAGETPDAGVSPGAAPDGGQAEGDAGDQVDTGAAGCGCGGGGDSRTAALLAVVGMIGSVRRRRRAASAG